VELAIKTALAHGARLDKAVAERFGRDAPAKTESINFGGLGATMPGG
jgi:hypothetical protein